MPSVILIFCTVQVNGLVQCSSFSFVIRFECCPFTHYWCACGVVLLLMMLNLFKVVSVKSLLCGIFFHFII